MKLVILAGGLGTRLASKTSSLPKPLLKIGSRPILWHIMKYYSCFGIKDFVVCLGYRGDMIKRYFMDYKMTESCFTIDFSSDSVLYHQLHDEQDWKITLADTGALTLKGGRLKKIEKFLDSDINFLTYADVLSDVAVDAVLDHHKGSNSVVTVTAATPKSPYGEIMQDKGMVTCFREKHNMENRLVNSGFMVFSKELMNCLTDDDNCDLEKGVLENLSSQGKVAAYVHKGNWLCMDTETDFENLNNIYREGEAFWKIW